MVTCRAARTRRQDGAETLPRGSVSGRARVWPSPPPQRWLPRFPLLPVSTLFLALPTPCFFHPSRVARWLVRPSFCIGADRAGRLRFSIGDMPFLQPVSGHAELGLFRYPKEAVKLFVSCCTRSGLSIYHILFFVCLFVLKNVSKGFVTIFLKV